ncbi:hypothetical protein [Paraburkholderia sp. DGU8]|uniref:hypothetical protein n=1 Tax=Paraburkholderia sp. DGU8 TaxID=3161997 RepID=UPI0034654DFD
MRKFILTVVAALSLTACSDKPAVYVADHLTAAATPAGTTVTLTLNKFSDVKNATGDGTMDIVKTPGSQANVKEGHYQVQWQALRNVGQVIVKVPEAQDSIVLGPPLLPLSDSFDCVNCEVANRAGQLGFLPGSFVHQTQ